MECSESFYRACVYEELKTTQSENPQSSKKMEEILARVHNQTYENEEFDAEMQENDEDLGLSDLTG